MGSSLGCRTGAIGIQVCWVRLVEMENWSRHAHTRTKGVMLVKFFGFWDRSYQDPGVLGAFGRNGESVIEACARRPQERCVANSAGCGAGAIGIQVCWVRLVEMENRSRHARTQTKGVMLGKFRGFQDGSYWDPGVLGAFGRHVESVIEACARRPKEWCLGSSSVRPAHLAPTEGRAGVLPIIPDRARPVAVLLGWSVSKDTTVRNSRPSEEHGAQARCCWADLCPRTPRSVVPVRVRNMVPRGGVVGLIGVQGHHGP